MYKQKRPYFFFVLVVILFILAFAGYSRYFYLEKLDQLQSQLLPTSENGFFNFFNAQKTTNLREEDESKSGILFELKPGDEFVGTLGLKNHEKIEHDYQIKIDPFSTDPEILFYLKNQDNQDINIGAGKIKFFDYIIKVPEDIKPGDYSTLISAASTDENSDKIKSGNFVFNLAVGLKIYLKVSDNPYIYKYENPSSQAKEKAYNLTIQRGGYILGIFFIFLTCYYLFKFNQSICKKH